MRQVALHGIAKKTSPPFRICLMQINRASNHRMYPITHTRGFRRRSMSHSFLKVIFCHGRSHGPGLTCA